MGKPKRLIHVDFQELERRPYNTLNKVGKAIIDKMVEISLKKNKILKPDNAQQAKIDLLFEAIQELTPNQQRVLKLYFGLEDGSTYTEREIGKIMSLSRGTIHRHKLRGIKGLKKRISLNEAVLKKIKKSS